MARHSSTTSPEGFIHSNTQLGEDRMEPMKAEPREIEYLLEQQQDQLDALDKAIAYLTTRLYSVTVQDEQRCPTESRDTEKGPRTELGNAIRNFTVQVEGMQERVNYLIRNCELP